MQLKAKCFLCEQEDDVLLEDSLFRKQIGNAFFTKNKDALTEEIDSRLRFCVVCVHKLQIGDGLKRVYDEMCNKNNRLNSRKCFFCESKNGTLVNLDENPIDVQAKIKVFLSFVMVQHDYRNLAACIGCLYSLNVWSEVQNQLYSIMKIPLPISNDVKSDKGKFISKRSSYESRVTPIKNKRSVNVRTKLNKKKTNWKVYLRKVLRNLNTADHLLKEDKLSVNNLDEFSIRQDDKLFTAIPYVQIFIHSQISRDALTKQGYFETVVLSDSEDDFYPKSQSLNNTPKIRKKNDDVSKSAKKAPFKIKFSPAFSKNLTLKNVHKYTCDVCDKGFSVRCDYLLHLLKHEKFESAVVKLARHDISTEMEDEELVEENGDKDKNLLTKEMTRQLVSKWIGENAAKAFDSSETNIESPNEDLLNETGDVTSIHENEDSSHTHSDEIGNNCDTEDKLEEGDEKSDEKTEANEEEATVEKICEKQTDEGKDTVSENEETNKSEHAENHLNEEDESGNVENSEDSDVRICSDTTKQVTKAKRKISRTLSVCEERTEALEGENKDKVGGKTAHEEENQAPSDNGTINVDDFHSDNSEEPPSKTVSPLLTSEDLINILDSNIDDEIVSKDKPASLDSSNADLVCVSDLENSNSSSTDKRKRSIKVDDDNSDSTPKRKRVRFANEMEIVTPDKSVILFEKMSLTDDNDIKDL